ncbi:hypothetical protein LR48_Vigan04g091500 [Vigna angularis]|uniref:Putative plant transposon protein domain-containing protein n=1 Tax=Phaseolus angularis TaxID=3914 RepID=A0A0L9UDU8_PHAAN|nr:hypothetical protein LR48_Vigan04g091500 [Vigna angularis]
MASSSWKRVKTVGNKRKDPERFNSNKFLSHKHERHFMIVQDRRLLMERKVGFLRAEWASKQCQFALSMDEGVDFDDVERTLCVPGGRFQRNKNDAPIHIRRSQLTPLSKYWMAFTHTNIQPCSHVSYITVHRAIFLYCVLKGLNINIGQVIANEIQTCASFVNNKAPLGHPSLITHLCELVGVNTSTPPMGRPRKEIDDSYYSQYCMMAEAAQQVLPPRPPRVHRRAPPPSQE